MYEDAALIALGSSLGGALGSPAAVIVAAVRRLADVGFEIVARSAPWRSRSWPDPTLPDYINALAIVETALEPARVLALLHSVEAEFGRTRGAGEAARNGPRVLDLDLIAYGRTVIHEGPLILPHPRAAERLFVMGPLAEIAPDWRHPVSGKRAKTLAARATVGRDATPL